VHMLRNDNAAAIDALTKALVLDPDNDDLYYRLGVCYQNTSKWDDALKTLTVAIQKNPKRGDAYFILGQTYLAKDKGKDAITALSLAVKPDNIPKDATYLAEAWRLLGKAWEAPPISNRNESCKAYKEYLKLAPPNDLYRKPTMQKINGCP
jgi:tetratricopeptide (TPR) repeat protein